MKSRPHTFTSTLSSHKPRIVGLLLELKVMSPKRSSSSDQSQKKTRFSKLLLNLFNIFNLCNHRKHTLPMHSLKVNLLLLNFFFFFLFRKYLYVLGRESVHSSHSAYLGIL